MPINYKRDYPSDWHEFSKRIRSERAANKCEWCGAPNGVWICRLKSDPAKFIPADYLTDTGGEGHYDGYATAIKVILTVAHLWKGPCTCHPKKCAIDSHVAALCQRCHLLYDLPHHQARARETRRRKKGEQMLPFGEQL